MGSQTRWLIHERVAYVKVSGVVTADDITRNDALLQRMVRGASSPIHVIVDARGVARIHVKVTEMSGVLKPENSHLFGWTIIVTNNRFVKFASAIFSRMTGNQFVTVATYDDAIRVMQENIPQLDVSFVK